MSADKLAQALRDLLSYAAENDPGQGDPERDDPRITAAAEALAAHEAAPQHAGRADAQPVDKLDAPTREALADVIATGLSGTWHCTRVWRAWDVGTMSQDDFEPVDESDTPGEIAEAILAMLAARAEKGGTS